MIVLQLTTFMAATAFALAVFLTALTAGPAFAAPALPAMRLSQKQASAFARLALKGITKEYPNKPGDVLNGIRDVKSPRAMHPAFYGSFDWHSSVHGHWMLVRVLRLFPDLPEKQEARKTLSAAAARHVNAALGHVASGDYAGEHWLASFATYLLSLPGAD